MKRALSRRRLLAGALAGGAAVVAACQAPAPTTVPADPTASPRPPATRLPQATASPVPPKPRPTQTPRQPSPSPASATATAEPVARGPWRFPFVPQEAPPTATAPPPPPATQAVPTERPAAAAPPPTPGPTNTPRPTPPPHPSPGPAQKITKVTKWGLGVYREGNEILKDLLVAKPTVILLMDPTEGWAQRVRGWFPAAFIVGRLFRHEAEQPLDNPGPRGTAFADRVARVAVPLRAAVDAWVSYNEVVGHNNYEDYRRYNEFQVTFARRLQDTHGIAAVAGNDGSGTVEPPDYARYFADAIRASRYFGVHAYSPLGSHRMRHEAEWHALRYRKIYRELENVGVKGVQMVMTESGLGDGWHNRVDDVIMAEEFFWFTDELEKDPYVIGHAAYGLFGDDTWKRFDMRGTDILTRMGHYEPPGIRAASGG